jgi:ferredoxin-NADP reductase
LFLIAGGSGIVPLMAMLRTRAAAPAGIRANAPATLLYSSRSLDDVIYRSEVAALAAADPTLRVVQTLTRAQPPGWTGFARRIDADMMAEVGPPPALAPHIYICGPTALVESAANMLVELGHDPARVKTERFGPTG